MIEWPLTDDQDRLFKRGVAGSYFFHTVGDSASKVLNSMQFLTYLFVIFIQRCEQWYILLKTKACITVNNVFLSKQCSTQLLVICASRRAIHSDTVVVILLSNVKFGSKIKPRSLADCTGEMSFPKKDK